MAFDGSAFDELIVDLFAGGGGASEGIRRALGRSPDIAINHDEDAIGVHMMNHPETTHYQTNVWQVHPVEVVKGRPVGLLWMSPDCKDFSKAKGAAPKSRDIRDLAWVGILWAERVRPRVIVLENVEEFVDWSPVGMDGERIADRKGETFKRFVNKLRKLGYKVEWKERRAWRFGDPTIRNRLLLIARCDGEKIVWPEPSNGEPNDADVLSGIKRPWRTAAECIDFSLPCPSIFMTREQAEEYRRLTGVRLQRPLKENTMARIAKGVQRYVIEAARPFIVPLTHHGAHRAYSIDEPFRTVTGAHRGELALIAPTLVRTAHGEADKNGKRRGRGDHDIAAPLPTTTGSPDIAVVAAFLAQHNSGMVGHPVTKPFSTICEKGSQQGLVTAHLLNLKGSDRRDSPIDAPAPTQCAGGNHIAEVRAFLCKYYGTGVGQSLDRPIHTITTDDRFGLVMVHGAAYQIYDIGMRMLAPRELFNAQGFRPNYIINRRADGKRVTKTAQVRLCGNSVPPGMAEAHIAANCADMIVREAEAA